MKLSTEERQTISDRFANELWPLNRAGNPAMALSDIIHSIEDDLLFSGGLVTFDIILAKYKEHLAFIKSNNANRDPQYHTRPDDISLFVAKKRYNEDFIPATIQETDRYLYGD